jgi:hypothetical protein
VNQITQTLDRYNRIVKVGDYVRFTTFMGVKVIGVVTIISDKYIGIKSDDLQYDRLHHQVIKVTNDEYMLYKLES